MPKRIKSDDNSDNQSKKVKATEIPDILVKLQKIFEAVNIFYAFCDAKLDSSITFQAIQKSIPNLKIEDLCAINVIIPSFVVLNLIDNDVLEVEFGRHVSNAVAKQKYSKTLGSRKEDWFKVGFRKANDKPPKPNAIKKMIEQKNKLFIKAMQLFLKHCEEHQLNVEEHLKKELEKYMPTPFFDDVDLFEDSDSNSVATYSKQDSIASVINRFSSLPYYGGQLESESNKKVFPNKTPTFGDIEISKPIYDVLYKKGITKLYIHQTEALYGLYDNQNVIISTSTASGKSLIYQIPVLESLLKDKSSKFLFIFPTKALAQDQMRSLSDIIQQIPELEGIMISTFDGDTPNEKRSNIRYNSSVIFTNPDMLHHAILPNVKIWSHFFSNLKYVVVDELHVYNGLFGTHMALIMRRLRRLCYLNGQNNIQFISCSATIRNPDQHMQTIFGIENVKLVDIDGAPHGQKEFVIWNPSLITPLDELSERRSAIVESAALMEYLLENKIRTIAFCKVRRTCELLMKQLRENLLQKQKKDVLDKVMSYRGGYTAETRRRIESQMFNGELLGIIATNALELGVDIGSLDAVLMVGVPWSISALWQQSGRAGRRNADSLSLVVCDKNPIDQFYANHPNELFEKKPSALSVNMNDPLILESHLQCAAEESPIDPANDHVFFGSKLIELCDKYLVQIDHGLYRPHPKFRPYPSQFVNIRKANEEPFVVVDVTNNRNVILEEIEVYRAGFEIYEGAIFIHQGLTYLVDDCDIDKKVARVHLVKVDWTTAQRSYMNVDILNTDNSRFIADTNNLICYGKMRVSTIVFGYYRLDRKGRIIDSHDIYMDPIVKTSTGIWVDIPSMTLEELDTLIVDPMAAIHAASHCLISLLPQFDSSIVNNLRTDCKNMQNPKKKSTHILLYESEPSGVVRQAFRFFDNLVSSGAKLIEECPCISGCPSCIHSSSCSERNEMSSKTGALIILKALIGKT